VVLNEDTKSGSLVEQYEVVVEEKNAIIWQLDLEDGLWVGFGCEISNGTIVNINGDAFVNL
jgi:hypothetical protein